MRKGQLGQLIRVEREETVTRVGGITRLVGQDVPVIDQLDLDQSVFSNRGPDLLDGIFVPPRIQITHPQLILRVGVYTTTAVGMVVMMERVAGGAILIGRWR